jgi:hypothetical protein
MNPLHLPARRQGAQDRAKVVCRPRAAPDGDPRMVANPSLRLSPPPSFSSMDPAHSQEKDLFIGPENPRPPPHLRCSLPLGPVLDSGALFFTGAGDCHLAYL